MPDESEWSERAKKHNGVQFLWIDQATDENLVAANSAGVCLAMTRDWVASCRNLLIDRQTFIRNIRAAQDEGPTHRFPKSYIEKQAAYRAENQITLNALESIMAEVTKETVAEAKEKLQKIEAQSVRTRFGEGVVDYGRLERRELLGAMEAVDHIKGTGKDTPSYFMLPFFKKKGGGGHVVGFECRPDKHVSVNYPKLYLFMDVNLGFYAFSSVEDMCDFFVNEVWMDLYIFEGYERFAMAQFDAGKGGFG